MNSYRCRAFPFIVGVEFVTFESLSETLCIVNAESSYMSIISRKIFPVHNCYFLPVLTGKIFRTVAEAETFNS